MDFFRERRDFVLRREGESNSQSIPSVTMVLINVWRQNKLIHAINNYIYP